MMPSTLPNGSTTAPDTHPSPRTVGGSNAVAPEGERTFRVDRMSSVASTGTAFQLPAGFDLAAAWDSISAELEVRRSGTQADITLPAALVGPLRDVLGARHVEEVEVGTDGRIHLRVTSNTTEMLARQLAGWAPEVDVVGPPEVRAALAEIGKELSSRYQS